MKQILSDYEVEKGTMAVFCENKSTINIFKNSIQHSHTKHIDARHYFIRELVETRLYLLSTSI